MPKMQYMLCLQGIKSMNDINALKYNIITFGCQMNERDSESIAGILKSHGLTSASIEEADIVVINTCSIRENANNKFYGTLGIVKNIKKKLKKNGDDLVVCVCGCMMQEGEVVEDLKARFPFVDVIFGTHNIDRVYDLIIKTIETKRREIEILENAEIKEMPVDRVNKHKAFVNITFGCNNFCTYCIVPYTRGREKSRSLDKILGETADAVSLGAKEVTFLGQNVNSYRGENGENFRDVLVEASKIQGLERIRFMTSHPKDLTDELIDVMSLDKIMPHIHLPVQSGSSEILKRMNRHYDRERYLEIVDKIYSLNEDIAITTDIIVGFPTETEEDFSKTLDLVRRARFDAAFTFMYSKRRNTKAANFDGQVDRAEMGRRFDMLSDLLKDISFEKNKKFVGRRIKVMVDKIEDDNAEGRSPEFKLVKFYGKNIKKGDILKVVTKMPWGYTISDGVTFQGEKKINVSTSLTDKRLLEVAIARTIELLREDVQSRGKKDASLLTTMIDPSLRIEAKRVESLINNGREYVGGYPSMEFDLNSFEIREYGDTYEMYIGGHLLVQETTYPQNSKPPQLTSITPEEFTVGFHFIYDKEKKNWYSNIWGFTTRTITRTNIRSVDISKDMIAR